MGYETMFADFTQLQTGSMKKVVSFGGYAFSTDASTSGIFPAAVSAANREAFAQNVVDVSFQ